MLYFKDFLHKVYLKIVNSKFIKWMFPVLLFVIVPSVKAEVVSMTDDNTFFGVTFNNANPLTYYTVPTGTNNYLELSVGLFNHEGWSHPWNYLVIQTCSNGYVARSQVRNSGYTNYFDSSVGYDADISGVTCQMRNGTIGRIGYIQMHVGRYGDIDGTGSELSANSYLRIENPLSYSWRVDIMSIMLSSDDLVTELRQNHLLLQVMTTNSNNTTAINNYLATMNSNISTQASNIQNSINSQTNAINGNIDQEFNDLKNQDHTYNNNAKDNVPNSSDVSSVTNAEEQLLDSIDLDSSSLDFTLAIEPSNFIWNIISTIRTTYGKITLLITTILSLAIIKMVLNR